MPCMGRWGLCTGGAGVRRAGASGVLVPGPCGLAGGSEGAEGLRGAEPLCSAVWAGR